jgi:phage gpG-like protein
MARDLKFLAEDMRWNAAEVNKMMQDVPRLIAGAAIKMKDANFSAQGFIENGSVATPWPKRKKETVRSTGKRVLHSTSMLRDSVKSRIAGKRISVGVDLAKVPYAQIHNEGGKAGRGLKAEMPERKYLGYTIDIEKITERELADRLNKIFNRNL